MAGTDTYNYNQDPEFLGAPTERQHAYLSQVEPDYAKAPKEQQDAYLSHLREHAPLPVEPNPAVNKIDKEIKEKGRIQKVGAPSELTGTSASPSEDAGTALGTSSALGAIANPTATVGSVVGGAIGAPLISSGSRRVTQALGGSKEAQDTAGTWGGYAGLLGGALIGGGLAGGMELPEEATIGNIKIKVPKWLNPKAAPTMEEEATLASQRKLAQREADIRTGVTQHPGVPAHAEMEADIAQQHQNRVAANDEMEQDIQNGRQERAAGRDTAHNDLANARMRRGAAQEKIDAGIPTEGSGQKVAVLPEPREPLPGDKPGSQWSVKRRTDLVGNAKRGQPGATDVIKNQRPVVLEPREGTGYGGPRQWDPNAPPEPPEAGPTVGKGPIKSPSGNGSFKSNKVISQEGSHLTGAEKLPGYDDYVDALVEKGMDKNKAYQTADNDMKLANQPDYPNQSERQVSLDRIRRIMGPEQRGPVRLGPEARGIK